MDRDTRNISLLYESTDLKRSGDILRNAETLWEELRANCFEYGDPVFPTLRNFIHSVDSNTPVEQLIHKFVKEELKPTTKGMSTRTAGGFKYAHAGSAYSLGATKFQDVINCGTETIEGLINLDNGIEDYKETVSAVYYMAQLEWKNWQDFYKHFYFNILRIISYNVMVSLAKGGYPGLTYIKFTKRFGDKWPEKLEDDNWWGEYRDITSDELADWNF
jgi:hypothetical protein